MAAKEIFLGTIKNHHPLPATGAEKPCPVTTIIAECPVKSDRLFNWLPLPAMGPVSIK
jgi:hypothetical protein